MTDLSTPSSTPGRGRIDSVASDRASRLWWDSDAESYHRTHGAFLGVSTESGEFVWCPEGLHEGDVHLLGDVADKDVLEVGCGSAPCARWLGTQGARAIGLDISMGMLQRGVDAMTAGGSTVPLVQASAESLPFVADSANVMKEVARVLRPGGIWVFAVNHPMRWVFPDDPGVGGLTATIPYFDRTPYVEYDADGTPNYVEHHRTIGDRVRELVDAGLEVRDIVREWGQWSPLRGQLFPGTAIFSSRKPL